jgi:peptidoglycan/LPS O-acetylase OafA/YrhL
MTVLAPAAPLQQTWRGIKGQIQELDGLRGIAILLVILHHFWPQQGFLARFSPLAHLGWIGVDLFFVISGFLITGILLDTRGDRDYYRNFYARRALRIFPLYYLFLLAAFTLIPLIQSDRDSAGEFFQQSGSPFWYLFYLGNLREAIVGKEPAYILAPLWSLSIEEQFYVCFPFIVASLSRERLQTLLRVMVFLAPAFRLAMFFIAPENERIQYLATFSRVDVLSLGCLLALEFRTQRCAPRQWPVGKLLLGLTGVMTVAFLLGGLDRTQLFCRIIGYSLVAVTFAALVAWTVLNRGQRCTALLRSASLCYLGKICYGVYLLQRPAEVILLKLSPKLGLEWDPASPALMLAKCGTAILLATLSWYLFERNVLKLKRLFASSRHPTEGAAGGQSREVTVKEPVDLRELAAEGAGASAASGGGRSG